MFKFHLVLASLLTSQYSTHQGAVNHGHKCSRKKNTNPALTFRAAFGFTEYDPNELSYDPYRISYDPCHLSNDPLEYL